MRAVVDAAIATGAATAVVPVVDTVKRVENARIVETLDRFSLFNTQTPQAFALDVLVAAHQQAQRDGVVADHDAALVERMGNSSRCRRRGRGT